MTQSQQDDMFDEMQEAIWRALARPWTAFDILRDVASKFERQPPSEAYEAALDAVTRCGRPT